MTLQELREGGKRALAAALAGLEAAPDDPATAALLDAAFAAPLGFSLGLTGPPGVGKSSLIDAMIRHWRGQGHTVGVIAVDPSSTRSGGALLGDRTRLTTDPGDTGVFVRSMAARDRLGGVAEITYPAMVLMRALFDLVIVETVGVGQSETEIAGVTDLVGFCAQPGSGDALQYMKAGVMEVPDLVIVTKADMGAVARRTVSDLKGALSLTAAGTIPVLSCAATEGSGIDDVLQQVCALSDHAAHGPNRSAARRSAQLRAWAEAQVRTRFGTEGLKLLSTKQPGRETPATFASVSGDRHRLAAALSAAFV